MVSINPIRKKFISSIKKEFVTKNIALPKETIIANVTKSKTNHIGCGGMDMLCSMYNMF